MREKLVFSFVLVTSLILLSLSCGNSNIVCTPGNHDEDKDGIRDYSLSCYINGNRKKRIDYNSDIDGKTKEREITYYESNGYPETRIVYYSDGNTKRSETTYYESNGNIKTSISYYTDGKTKRTESTLYESNENNIRTVISYESDGTKKEGYPKCYTDSSSDREEKTCEQATHGCTSTDATCIPDGQTNGIQ